MRPVPKRTFRPRLSPRPTSRAFVGVRVNPDHPRCSLSPVVPLSAGAASAGAPASAGEILKQLEDLLADTEAAIEADPSNESLLGQRTFFENQLERVQANATYLDRLRPKVSSGDAGYLQRIVLVVDKDLFDDEVYFWKNAMGMRVTRERKDVEGLNGGRCVVFAYGQETLTADDGGKAGVELREASSTPSGGKRNLGNGLDYVSVAVPYGIRVSRIYESGGELVYGFGYFDVRSPSGYAVRARVAARRDSAELVAVNVADVKATERYYVETFGMVGRAPLDENGYAPKSPPGSRLLTFGDPKETMGLLLQPLAAKVDAGTELDVGDVYGGVVVVTNSQRMASRAGEVSSDGAGYRVTVEGYDAWESEVESGGKTLDAKWNAPLAV